MAGNQALVRIDVENSDSLKINQNNQPKSWLQVSVNITIVSVDKCFSLTDGSY